MTPNVAERRGAVNCSAYDSDLDVLNDRAFSDFRTEFQLTSRNRVFQLEIEGEREIPSIVHCQKHLQNLTILYTPRSSNTLLRMIRTNVNDDIKSNGKN